SIMYMANNREFRNDLLKKLCGRVLLGHVRQPSSFRSHICSNEFLHPYATKELVGVHNGSVPITNQIMDTNQDFDTAKLFEAIENTKEDKDKLEKLLSSS